MEEDTDLRSSGSPSDRRYVLVGCRAYLDSMLIRVQGPEADGIVWVSVTEYVPAISVGRQPEEAVPCIGALERAAFCDDVVRAGTDLGCLIGRDEVRLTIPGKRHHRGVPDADDIARGATRRVH